MMPRSTAYLQEWARTQAAEKKANLMLIAIVALRLLAMHHVALPPPAPRHCIMSPLPPPMPTEPDDPDPDELQNGKA